MFRLFATVTVFSFCFFILRSAHSEDLNVETTAEGITNRLTVPGPKKNEDLNVETTAEGATNKLTAPEPPNYENLGFENTTEDIINRLTALGPKKNNVNLKILFDSNSYTIRDESIPLLNELGKALTDPKLAGKSFFIQGHTDSDGFEAYNLELSKKRGFSVKQYLATNYSIEPPNLKVVGFGESSPLVPDTSKKNKQVNRRVAVELRRPGR